MGNKNSVNISDPAIKSYTQHPAGFAPNATSTVPRRNSFTNGVPPDSNTIQRSTTLMSAHMNHAKSNGKAPLNNGKVAPNNRNVSKNQGKNGINTSPPILVNGKEEISRPGTNDSGYFTGYMTDSDKSERARTHGSRASLNEGVFAVPPPPMPFYGPIPPNQMGPMHMPPFPPPDPFRMGMFPPPVESKKAKKWRKKQQRKLISRHESLMSTLDAPYPMPPPFAMMPPPPPGPGSFNPMLYRAQSMDNLHINARNVPIPPSAPHQHHHGHHFVGPSPRRYTSQTDLRFANNRPQLLALPPIPHIEGGKYDKKGKKPKESKKDGSLKGSILGTKNRQQNSAPSSRSGKNSRIEEANTRFEEERIIKPSEMHHTHIVSNMKEDSPELLMKQNPPDVIYETLKAARHSTLLTKADIEFEKKREMKENIMNISFEKPLESVLKQTEEVAKQEKELPQPQSVVITPEAKAVMERNAELLANAEKNEAKLHLTDKSHDKEVTEASVTVEKKHFEKSDAPKVTKVASKPVKDENETLKLKKTESDYKKPINQSINQVGSEFQPSSSYSDKLVEEKRQRNTSDSSNDSLIEAVLNPILLRRKMKKPQSFEPLDAWRDISVHAGPSRSQNGFISEECAVKENLTVKLVPTPPSRRESHAEPIYLEYDERLPEFKKRLIETGSFDFPEIEKFHHSSQYSGSKAKDLDSSHDLENVQPVAREETKKPRRKEEVNSSARNDGSLKRLKDSVANIFGTKLNNNKSVNLPESDIRLAANHKSNSERCLTPTTAKIKAGDSSDIDFSWVHDLETRFRREREQFERELETRKQLTLQRNGSLAHSQVSDHFRRQNDAVSSKMDFNNFSTKELSNGLGYKSSPQLNNGYGDCNNADPIRNYIKENETGYDSAATDFAGNRNGKLQSPVPNNVRNKAALFENEAQRLQSELDLKHQQMVRQKNTVTQPNPRMVSNNYRSDSAVEEPIYIPKPDYEGESFRESMINDERMNRYLKHRDRPPSRNNVKRDYSPANDLKGSTNFNENNRGYESSSASVTDSSAQSNTVLQVETSHQIPSYYRHQSSFGSPSPRSPCQKKLNRFYGHQGGGYSKTNCNSEMNGMPVNGNKNVNTEKFSNVNNEKFTNLPYSSTINNSCVPTNGGSSFGLQYCPPEKFPDPYVEDKNREFVQRMNEITAHQHLNGYSRMKGYDNGYHVNGNDTNKLSAHYVSQPSFGPSDQLPRRDTRNGHFPYNNDRPLLRKLP